MPKVDVFLSDDLYEEVQALDLPLSSIAEDALWREVARRRNDEWIDRSESRPMRRQRLDTLAALDAAREELGA